MYPKYHFLFYIHLYWYLLIHFYIFNIVTCTPRFTICFEINFEGGRYSWSRIYLHRWIFETGLTAAPWLTEKHRSENAVSRNCEEPPLQVVISDVLRYVWRVFILNGSRKIWKPSENQAKLLISFKKRKFKILPK